MFNFHRIKNQFDKQEAYEYLRNIVLEDFNSATIAETEEGYHVTWMGIAIGQVRSTPYDAWSDVALPY